MSGRKAALGYPSRTAAIIGLRQQGLTTREIANQIGIDLKTVSALECSARRTSRQDVNLAVRPELGGIPLGTRQRLRVHAAKRGISVDRLIISIIDAVSEDNLVDAVLDDRSAL